MNFKLISFSYLYPNLYGQDYTLNNHWKMKMKMRIIIFFFQNVCVMTMDSMNSMDSIEAEEQVRPSLGFHRFGSR